MNKVTSQLTLGLAIGLLVIVSAQAGSLEPPPGPVSPTRPPDTCFDNTGNRFVDCGDGTIKDTVTGLFWLKNATCFGFSWADANKAAAELAHGQCGLTDGSLPGDWRLPTLGCPGAGVGCPASDATGEFGVILNLASANGCTFPAVPDTQGTGCWSEGDPFSGVLSTNYWSASTFANNPLGAWGVTLTFGEAFTAGKFDSMFVWPVRGGP